MKLFLVSTPKNNPNRSLDGVRSWLRFNSAFSKHNEFKYFGYWNAKANYAHVIFFISVNQISLYAPIIIIDQWNGERY